MTGDAAEKLSNEMATMAKYRCGLALNSWSSQFVVVEPHRDSKLGRWHACV